jgi:hypothetical protein
MFEDDFRSGHLLRLLETLTIEEIEVLQTMFLRVGSDLQKAKEGKLNFMEIEADNESFREVKRKLLLGEAP